MGHKDDYKKKHDDYKKDYGWKKDDYKDDYKQKSGWDKSYDKGGHGKTVQCPKVGHALCCKGVDYENDCLAEGDGIKDIKADCTEGTCSSHKYHANQQDVHSLSFSDDSDSSGISPAAYQQDGHKVGSSSSSSNSSSSSSSSSNSS